MHQAPARRSPAAARRAPGRAGSLGAAAEQRDRAAGIAAVSVRQPDRDLGEALPQVALVGWAGLP